MKHSFCEDWEFTHHWTEAFGKGLPVPKQQAVRLPHTCREVPLHYASPADYEMVCGYRKRFRVPPVQAAPRLFLRFDGAAHQAVRVSDLHAIVVVLNDQIQALGTAFGYILVGVALHSGHLPQGLTRRAVLILRVGVEAGVLDARVVAHFLHGGLGRDVGLSLFHYGTGGQGQQCQQTQHHRDDSFCLFHVPFLSPGTALIAFFRTEDYNMRLHRRHRLVFVLLYHTRRYCQNKSVRKIHAL